MSDEINIRAAKAMGWAGYEHGKYNCTVDQALVDCGWKSEYQYHMMHFHDSYDWAMLLVKECDKRGLLATFIHVAADFMTQLMRLTPEEITRACLEVMEDK